MEKLNQETKNQMFWMLQDVISYFSKNPVKYRSKSLYGKCGYQSNGVTAGCAIGMYIDQDLAKELDDYEDSSILEIFEQCKSSFQKLPEWMKIMPIDFLSELQALHDNDFNWDKNNLSKDGIDTVKEICENFELPFKKLTFKK